MNDITDKLAAILDDPASMETIKAMAGNLLGGQGVEQAAASASRNAQNESKNDGLNEMLSAVSPEQMGSMLRVLKAFNSTASDDRTKLLLALRPHLSPPRRERLDKAVKLMKLVTVMPALSESGLFKL